MKDDSLSEDPPPALYSISFYDLSSPESRRDKNNKFGKGFTPDSIGEGKFYKSLPYNPVINPGFSNKEKPEKDESEDLVPEIDGVYFLSWVSRTFHREQPKKKSLGLELFLAA